MNEMLRKMWGALVWFFGTLAGVLAVIERPLPRRKLGADPGHITIAPDFNDPDKNAEIAESFRGKSKPHWMQEALAASDELGPETVSPEEAAKLSPRPTYPWDNQNVERRRS